MAAKSIIPILAATLAALCACTDSPPYAEIKFVPAAKLPENPDMTEFSPKSEGDPDTIFRLAGSMEPAMRTFRRIGAENPGSFKSVGEFVEARSLVPNPGRNGLKVYVNCKDRKLASKFANIHADEIAAFIDETDIRAIDAAIGESDSRAKAEREAAKDLKTRAEKLAQNSDTSEAAFNRLSEELAAAKKLAAETRLEKDEKRAEALAKKRAELSEAVIAIKALEIEIGKHRELADLMAKRSQKLRELKANFPSRALIIHHGDGENLNATPINEASGDTPPEAMLP